MKYKISDKVKYIHNILCKTEKIYYSLLRSKQMTDSEYILLYAVLEMGEGCSQKDIAENTFISKKTLNSTVKKLQQNGIITLKPGSKYPNMDIYLTEKGATYVQEKMIPIMEAENAVLKNVTDEDFESFALVAEKYIDLFNRCSENEEDLED